LYVKLLNVGGDAVFVAGFLIEVGGEGVGDFLYGAPTVDPVPNGGAMRLKPNANLGGFASGNEVLLHEFVFETRESYYG
jgi:hypothetical protein